MRRIPGPSSNQRAFERWQRRSPEYRRRVREVWRRRRAADQQDGIPEALRRQARRWAAAVRAGHRHNWTLLMQSFDTGTSSH
jgi:hypothetical protein